MGGWNTKYGLGLPELGNIEHIEDMKYVFSFVRNKIFSDGCILVHRDGGTGGGDELQAEGEEAEKS